MALHDPESTAQEKAMALKMGRQKKIQIIDGQQVEILEEIEDEEYLEDEEDISLLEEDEDAMAQRDSKGMVSVQVQLSSQSVGATFSCLFISTDDNSKECANIQINFTGSGRTTVRRPGGRTVSRRGWRRGRRLSHCARSKSRSPSPTSRSGTQQY